MPKIKEIRHRKEEYVEVLRRRFMEDLIPKVEEGIKLYASFVEKKKELDRLRAERNRLSVEYARKRDERIRERVRKIKEKMEKMEREVKELEEEVRKIELLLPNWIDERVPIGEDDTKNVTVKYWGSVKVLPENEGAFVKEFPGVKYRVVPGLLHHADIVEKFNLVDMEAASRIAGARFYIEKGPLAVLDLAFTLWSFREFVKEGFYPIIPPELMRRSVEEKITYYTSFQESIYELKEEGLLLIPTSEHPLVGVFANHTFKAEELPLRLVAFTHAFRREAGAHGKDTKGIFRVHQFGKVELHSITEPGEDRDELEFLLGVVEKLMQRLKIPYRVVINSSGDMDKRALLQMDVEAWFPAQNTFRELHSLATMGSWVSEKVNTKVLRGNEKVYVANLYATGFAVQRTLLAIFVNNYDPEKGEIEIPKVLREYCGFDRITLSQNF